MERFIENRIVIGDEEMAWNDIDLIDNKPTEKQIQFAEVLMEAIYGDIYTSVRSMTKREVSKLIDKLKTKAEEEGINYAAFYPKSTYKQNKKKRRRRNEVTF